VHLIPLLSSFYSQRGPLTTSTAVRYTAEEINKQNDPLLQWTAAAQASWTVHYCSSGRWPRDTVSTSARRHSAIIASPVPACRALTEHLQRRDKYRRISSSNKTSAVSSGGRWVFSTKKLSAAEQNIRYSATDDAENLIGPLPAPSSGYNIVPTKYKLSSTDSRASQSQDVRSTICCRPIRSLADLSNNELDSTVHRHHRPTPTVRVGSVQIRTFHHLFGIIQHI